MTYRSYVGQAPNGYTNESWGFPSTPMMLDIGALQRMYGANFNFNSGDSVYSWSPTSGQSFVNGAGGPLPGGNPVFITVWGGGGNDTFRWHSVENAGLGAQADIVTDFVRGADRIDLAQIDAILGASNNDS